MFDSNKSAPKLKTTGILTLLGLKYTFEKMDLSNLELLILLLNLMKDKADDLSDDKQGSTRLVIGGFQVQDWIDDAMSVYNNKLN